MSKKQEDWGKLLKEYELSGLSVSVRRNTPTKAHHHRSCYELYRTRSMKYVKETRGLGEVIKGV